MKHALRWLRRHGSAALARLAATETHERERERAAEHAAEIAAERRNELALSGLDAGYDTDGIWR